MTGDEQPDTSVPIGPANILPGQDIPAQLMGMRIAVLRDTAEHVEVSPEERAVLEQKARNQRHYPYARVIADQLRALKLAARAIPGYVL